MQTIETSIFNVNGDSLPGLLIIGTFEKRVPGHPDPQKRGGGVSKKFFFAPSGLSLVKR